MLATVYKQNNLLWNNLNEVTTTNQLQASLSCMDATMHGHILYFTENTNIKNFTTTYRVNGKITLMRYLNNRKSDFFFSLNYFLIEFFPPPALFMVLFHWFITHCGIFPSISLSSHPSQSANFTPLNKNASRVEGKTKKKKIVLLEFTASESIKQSIYSPLFSFCSQREAIRLCFVWVINFQWKTFPAVFRLFYTNKSINTSLTIIAQSYPTLFPKVSGEWQTEW